jgi:apolipoprotein D and lipocalin family protein
MTWSFAMLRPVALVLFGLGLVSCSTTRGRVDAPVTAEAVDLSRYIGRWYEIARLPMRFQKPNEAAIAEYGTNPDGTISVHNIAIRPDGSERDIRGYAKVLNPPENTKLTVRFKTWFGPLIPVPKDGNYWILHVDEDYEEAIVGTPNRKYLWLLARTPTVPDAHYEALVAKADQLGFETYRLLGVPHRQMTTLQGSQP